MTLHHHAQKREQKRPTFNTKEMVFLRVPHFQTQCPRKPEGRKHYSSSNPKIWNQTINIYSKPTTIACSQTIKSGNNYKKVEAMKTKRSTSNR